MRTSHVVALLVFGVVVACADVARAQTDAPMTPLETAVACGPAVGDAQAPPSLHLVGSQDTASRAISTAGATCSSSTAARAPASSSDSASSSAG